MAEERSRRLRLFFRVLAVLLLLGFLALLYDFLADERPSDDSDLRLERTVVAAEENGFVHLSRALEKLALSEEESRQIGDLTSPEGWNATAAEKILERNREFLDAFAEALNRAHFQVPAITSISDPIPYFKQWRATDHLVDLRAVTALKTGNLQAACESALQLARFGKRIQDAEGTLAVFLFGRGIEELGLRTLRQAAGELTDLSSVQEIGRRFEEHSPSQEGCIRSLKAEYAVFSNLIAGLAAGTIDLDHIEEGPSRDDGEGTLPWSYRLVFKPNQTRRYLAENFRALIESARLTNRERNPLKTDGQVSFAARLPHGNPLGKAILGTARFSERVRELASMQTFDVVSTRVYLALKACKLKNGQLPPALEDLVPEFLAGVPLDPFDGQPLRYSAERRGVYSIGTDLKDAGGLGDPQPTDDEAARSLEEPTVRIRF